MAATASAQYRSCNISYFHITGIRSAFSFIKRWKCDVILANGAYMKVRQKLYKLCCLGVKTIKVPYLAITQVQNEGETESENTIRTGRQVIGVQQIRISLSISEGAECQYCYYRQVKLKVQ